MERSHVHEKVLQKIIYSELASIERTRTEASIIVRESPEASS